MVHNHIEQHKLTTMTDPVSACEMTIYKENNVYIKLETC